MPARRLLLVLAFGSLLLAREKVSDPGHAENAAVSVHADAYADANSIKQLLGSDLGGYYTVLQVTVTPKAGKLSLQRDDFLLRTDKDGERTRPLAASQVAGSSALVVKEVRTGGGAMGNNNGPIWGGIGGGMPSQLPGNGGGVGNGAGGSAASSHMEDGKKGKVDPMLAVLKEKMLPEKEIDQPVSGLLVFNLEKQKLKDLELVYTTPQGEIRIRFR